MTRSIRNLGAAAAVAIAFSVAAPAQGQDLGLVTELAGLGVSQDQAAGGLLAMMQLAKTNLGPADFGKLMGMVPEIGDFMGGEGGGAAAGAMGAATGAMGAATAKTSKEEAAAADQKAQKEQKEHKEQAAHKEHKEHKAHAAGAAPAGEAMVGADRMMGEAAGGMPQITGLTELAAVPSLVSAFQGLGMGPEMIQQFAPIILKYVMGSGGSAAAQLLGTGLGLGLM